MGRHSESIDESSRAKQIDPLSLAINSSVAQSFYFARQYDPTIEQCEKMLEMEPNYASAHLILSFAFKQKGMEEKSIEALKKYFALLGNSEVVEALIQGYATSGYVGSMSEAAQKLVEQSKTRYISSCWIAGLYAHAEQTDESFQWLEKGHEARDPMLSFIGVAPYWDTIRDDPRFQGLLRRMNVPQ
jgi:tetratricopeptide (TPR) repeat protein